MTGSAVRAPWFLARCAQFAVPASAGVRLVWWLQTRSHPLHPSTAPAPVPFGARISVLVSSAAAVLFLVWFARCRRNADLVSPGRVPGSVAWAVLSWLIPGFNLWVPRGLVQDVQRASTPGGQGPGRSDAVINLWWVAWVGYGVLSLAAPDVGDGTSLPLQLVTQALGLLAAGLAVAVVERLTRRQAAGLSTVVPVPVPAGPPVAP